MYDHMIQRLKKSAEKPDPVSKDTFIRRYRTLECGKQSEPTYGLILSQVTWIGWYVWAISFGVLLLAVLGLRVQSRDVTRIVSALMPFVSLVAILGSFRSKWYAVMELESVTRYFFRGIYFARLACIGALHILMIAVLVIILGGASENSYLMTGGLITIPYLLSSAINTRIERTSVGRRSAFLCVGVSAMVSALTIAVNTRYRLLEDINPLIWGVVLLLAITAQCYETIHTLKLKWEVCSWN